MNKGNLISPNIRIFTFCENIIQDKKDRFSLINLFDTIHYLELPGSISFIAFIQIFFISGNYSLLLKATGPKEKNMELATREVKMDKPGVHNLIVNMNLTFDKPGKYNHQIFINDVLFGEVELNVLLEESSKSKK